VSAEGAAAWPVRGRRPGRLPRGDQAARQPGHRAAPGGSGMAGLPAGCLRTPDDPGPGGGRQPGIIE